MIVFSASLPGRFGEWCNAVLAKLAGQLGGGSVATISSPTLGDMFGYEALAPPLDEMARLMIASPARHFAIAIRQPDQRLRDALVRGGARLVLALDDPRNAVADILAETSCPAKTAVRAVANCCPLLMPFAAMPGTLAIRADEARADPLGVVAAIAAHFAIAVEPEAAAAIAAELPPPDEVFALRLPANVGKIADGALGAYGRSFAGADLDRIIWTRELFFIVGDITIGPTSPLEVGGGARVLIYGPYIHLPAGSWSAQVVLGFSPEAAASSFLVDVYADGQLASTTFQPGRSGAYTADLIFSVGEPGGKGVEVRIWVMSDTAVGRLALGHVVLQPLARRDAVATEASADFERVLDL